MLMPIAQSCGSSHGTLQHSCPRHGKEHSLGSASLEDLPYELVEQVSSLLFTLASVNSL